MAEKPKSTPARGIVIYILLVIITGMMLSATGHFDNPIADIQASLVSEESGKGAISGSERSEDQAKAGSPNEGHPDNENKSGASSSGDRTQSHTEALSINWSRTGDVLFDIWFLAMVTAILIVIQQIFGFTKQLVQKRLHPS